MKKILIIIVILFIAGVGLGVVNASLNLSPGKLYFNLNPGEKSCQEVIVVSSDYSGTLKVRDIWNKDLHEQNLNNYNLKSQDIGIQISYPEQIENFNAQQEVEVCLTASRNVNYRGSLIFTPTSNTNIVVEVGTWLFVIISGASQTTTSSDTQSSATTTGAEQATTTQTQTTQAGTEQQTTSTTDEQQNNNAGITGAAVGGGSKLTNIVIYFIVGLLIAGVLVFTIKSWRKARWQRGL